MNEELLEMLSNLGLPGLDAEDAWKRVLMVFNHGRVPAEACESPKGFKMILLDEKGFPEWFGRCSWADLESMVQETYLLEALAKDEFARNHVPELHVAASRNLYLQLTRYIGECSYLRKINTITPSAWFNDIREIISTSERVLRVAEKYFLSKSGFSEQHQRPQFLRQDIDRIRNELSDESTLAAVEGAIEAIASLPQALQHGDLWPANVLNDHDHWWLVDFAECGHVWTPGYDFFHILSVGPAQATGEWYGVQKSRSADAWTRVRWDLVAWFAERHHLSAASVGAAFMYYLVHLTAYRMRPGLPAALSEIPRSMLKKAGRFLAESGELSTLIPIGES